MLEVPPNKSDNIRMLSKKEIDKLEIGDAVSYDGDDYMVIGKFEEGYDVTVRRSLFLFFKILKNMQFFNFNIIFFCFLKKNKKLCDMFIYDERLNFLLFHL